MRISKTVLMALALLGVSVAMAALPPDLVNYQGVLRNSDGDPLDGDHDMVFRFFTDDPGGDEIVVDSHLAVNAQAVTVTDGMFNVAMGSGAVIDGSGPGTYAGLAAAFGAYSALWLEVQIGAETLSPRTRVAASGYALNAQYLEGRSASEFVDTTSTGQAKPGKLVAGAASGTTFAYGLEGYGSYGGGYFSDSDDGSYARVGWGGIGIDAAGDSQGASFTNSAVNCYALVATPSFGIYSECEGDAAHFKDLSSGALGNIGAGNYGVFARGPHAGGYFSDLDGSGYAELGQGDVGLRAYGNIAGAVFTDLDDTGSATLASGNTGVTGSGILAGAYFNDSDGTGYAWVGNGDVGIRAHGSVAGGTFSDTDGTGIADLGYGDQGVVAYGSAFGGYFKDADDSGYAEVGSDDYGIQSFGNFAGGFFQDLDSSAYADVAVGDYGIRGYGNVAGAQFEDLTNSGYARLGTGDYGLQGYGNYTGGYFLDLDSSSYGRVGHSIYKIFGSGTVSFAQNHPEDPEKVVVYHAPESSEVAVYTRGTAVLVDGVARVALDETFQWVTNPDLGLTAHLTPRGVPASLALESVSTTELVVRGPAGSNAEFDYMVWGLRIGFEEAAPVQPKEQESYIPSMETQRALYTRDANLRRFNSLERYRNSAAQVRGVEASAIDLSRSAALVAQIGEYGGAVHGAAGAELDATREAPLETATRGTATGPDAPGTFEEAVTHVSRSVRSISRDSATKREITTQPDETMWLPVETAVEPGEVLALSIDSPGQVQRAATMADPNVVGVAAGASRRNEQGRLEAPLNDGRYATVKVDAGYGAILPGDLLVSSPTAGHAMRAVEALPGTIVGKAIDALETGTGTVRALLMGR